MAWLAERRVAERAGRVAMALLSQRPSALERKGSIDLVTDVDRRCEAALREVLERELPGVEVLGEEGGGSAASTRWVVDPVDGTTNFVHGFPWYACSIALEVEGQSVVAVVVEPVRGRMFVASRGDGAFVGEERLAVSTTATLADALLGTGFPYDRASRAPQLLGPYQRALETTRGVRRPGAASLDLAYVAAGALDGFWEYDLSLWDVAAGCLLIEEAGGRVTDHTNQAQRSAPTSPLASNGLLHDALFEMLELGTENA